ncbi:hypothetical protein N431DRAFT_93533 [Stipitochalara longipes BDJ]|nr:hypothetical protein N431DRAFT_93533 [Stipitochalara longipes BDJ]
MADKRSTGGILTAGSARVRFLALRREKSPRAVSNVIGLQARAQKSLPRFDRRAKRRARHCCQMFQERKDTDISVDFFSIVACVIATEI